MEQVSYLILSLEGKQTNIYPVLMFDRDAEPNKCSNKLAWAGVSQAPHQTLNIPAPNATLANLAAIITAT